MECFFHLKTPDGVELDMSGSLHPDAESAYLAACEAIPDVAADLLRERRNPMLCTYMVADADGQTLFEIPFSESIRFRTAAPTSTHFVPARPTRVEAGADPLIEAASRVRERARAANERAQQVSGQNLALNLDLAERVSAIHSHLRIFARTSA